MDWFPTPYPDETFYSVLARLYRYLGRPNYSAFSRALSGRRHYVSLCHLPCGIADLAARFGWSDEELKRLIHDHTALPYFTAFASAEVRAKAAAQMLGRGASLQFSLGLSTSKVPLPETLQFCPDCIKRMLKERGEAWWLRTHQLPGVAVCPDHGSVLRRTVVRVCASERHRLVCPDEGNCPDSAPPLTSASASPQSAALLVGFARASRRLLQVPPQPRSERQIWQGYRRDLARRGLLRGTDHVRHQELAAIAAQYWGDALDQFPGLRFSKDTESSWLIDFVRNKRSLHAPARHLLFQLAVAAAPAVPRPFGEPPWICENPLAGHFGQRTVVELKLIRHRGKVHAHFRCECGYCYSRTQQVDGTIGNPRIREFGPDILPFLRKAKRENRSLRSTANLSYS
jgi:AraC-like DNA-binding protein